MQILPLQTPIIHPGDDLIAILSKHEFQDGDIVVISSKAVATSENALIDLSTITASKEAEEWAMKCGGSSRFRQAILDETRRMHGSVVGDCPQAMLTELKPDGLTEGSLLTANAGLDLSNVPEGFAVGWPRDPVGSVRRIRNGLESWFEARGHVMVRSDERTRGASNHTYPLAPHHDIRIAVLISDSCCRPRRMGVTAYALVVSGFDPLQSQVGTTDLFGRPLVMTQEARADQLATAANFVMGNANQSTPAAIIRDHGLEMSSFGGWVPGINRDEDLFHGAL